MNQETQKNDLSITNEDNTVHSDDESVTTKRLHPHRFTTANKVTPMSNKRSRRENEEDLLKELIDDTKPEDHNSTLHPFPFCGMTSLLQSQYQPNGIDPRGPNPKSCIPRNRHDVYCDSCK